MTIIRHDVKSSDLKKEIRQIRETARKVAASKESALRFLVSTGAYTKAGKLKPAYR